MYIFQEVLCDLINTLPSEFKSLNSLKDVVPTPKKQVQTCLGFQKIRFVEKSGQKKMCQTRDKWAPTNASRLCLAYFEAS